ncbi:serine hydrolase domain-containing protein [Pseudoalteromonas aurantia]|uniref:Beta-lactamase-related domain-containing protein n=1 Tax=Pseudoalteromonas aurantia 208 TaxID=1314867 RepID=A0ABR9ECP9_9GAMM|nr:serine hydrolase domain-containing protein [Pseudoalteromonas aurantia]MBE0367533.1 hypothetical protein [Pseudoalteromonas aurantia 208]
MRYFLPWLFFTTCFHFSVTAQEELDHMKLASTFLTILNSQDMKQLDAFVVNNFSPDALSRWDGAGKDRFTGYSINQAMFHGHLDVISFKLNNSDNQIRYVGQLYSMNTDMQYEMVINFNRAQARAITGWYIRENPQTALNSTPLNEAQVVSQLTKYSKKLANNGIFSGTILLAKGEHVLFTAAHGLASHRYDVKNHLDTKFQIGSMNKMFTSIAILQLVEQNRLSLDDPLTKFVNKDLLGKGDFKKIKVRHLLTHTSGISGMTGFEEIQTKVRTLQHIQPLLKSIDTTFEPASQWQYSNTGMVLLGYVIEAVSGQRYFDYINDNIYHKANMLNSGSFDLDVPIKNTARNYWFSVETGAITENLMFQSVKGDPAGGGYSTVRDLHKFALALQQNKLLSKDLTLAAVAAKPALNAPNWGYGFSVSNNEGNTIVGHNGAHLGMTAQLNIYQDKGYILVVLGNYLASARPVVAKANKLIERL